MGVTYGDKHETLQPSHLTDSNLLAVGRLIRAFVGIEEIVSTYLAILTQVPPNKLVIVLGKTALRRRIEMAGQLAKLEGDDEFKRFEQAFPADFYHALNIRNAVAHGLFIGMDGEGCLSFLTEKTDRPEEGDTIQMVVGIKPEELEDLARKVEMNVAVTARLLRLASSLQTLQQAEIRPHRKAQPKRPPSAKPKDPPQSSPE